tara:strand:- start:19 stop:666 length:648 start_codon:yes stop_codon:yes gene_type:complete
MLLITETVEGVTCITEERDAGGKDYYIEGIFMQSEKKNRNGRVYPKDILTSEVNRYNKEFVRSSRALGELGHPEGPTINLERVSHMIKELNFDGNNVIGKAKIMDTPYGKIVQNLIDEGVKIGVSSRGMGSLKKNGSINEVQKDFYLSAVDIVADPSAPDAFVEGIMEGKEWVWENGILKARNIDSYKTLIQEAPNKQELQQRKIDAFCDFISRL